MSSMEEQKTQVWFALVGLLSFVLMLPQADLHQTLASQKHTLLHNGECSSLICCFGLTGWAILHWICIFDLALFSSCRFVASWLGEICKWKLPKGLKWWDWTHQPVLTLSSVGTKKPCVELRDWGRNQLRLT